MGKLLDAVAAERTARGPLCSAGALIASLPAEVRADLQAMFESGTATTVLVRALARLGYPATVFPMQRHRRGDCNCVRPS
jgi:hypothetical protein